MLPSELAQHTPSGLSPQVQPLGQSESASQATSFSTHALTPLGSQVQSGGSGAAAPDGGTSAGSGALSSSEPELPGSDGGNGSADGDGSVAGRVGGVEPLLG